MRDPRGLNERFFAALYPKLVERSEKAAPRECTCVLRTIIGVARTRA